MINDDILAHARQCAPAESCGYVVRTAQGERYFPCENLSAEPTMYFRISPEDYLNARNRGDIVALVHSHPDGKPCLSSADRTLQIQSGLDWWLVCDNRIHKFRCVPHLTGRQFEHGVTDCYTLFRDAYHLAGIDMPDSIGKMTGGVRVKASIWITWRRRDLPGESGGCAARRRADLLFWFTDAQSCGDLLRQR